MNTSLGYIKDGFALFYFSICAYKLGTVASVSEHLRKELLTYFILGFCVDFAFSIYPNLHHSVLGNNCETYLFLAYFLVAFLTFLYYNL